MATTAAARVLLLLIAVAVTVNAHSLLTSPPAWNPQPSKSAPCGAGAAVTTSQLVVTPGATLPLTWKVVAGDGVGPVTVSIDTTGGITNFSTVVGTSSTSITSTGTFYITDLVVPMGLRCTGASGLCTLRIKSTSNWYSCATISVASSVAGSTGSASTTGTTGSSSRSSTGVTRQCTTVPALKFCSTVQGQSVDYSENAQLLPAAIAAWDVTVNSTYVQNLGSPLVFTHQHTPECYTAYKRFLCAESFPKCGQVDQGTCTTACLNVRTACGVNATHNALFICGGSANTLTSSDSYGSCPADMSVSGAVALHTVSAALLALLLLLATFAQ